MMENRVKEAPVGEFVRYCKTERWVSEGETGRSRGDGVEMKERDATSASLISGRTRTGCIAIRLIYPDGCVALFDGCRPLHRGIPTYGGMMRFVLPTPRRKRDFSLSSPHVSRAPPKG